MSTPESSLSSQAFEPLQRTDTAQTLTRPSLSYWQDAWLRLRENRRALISLYLIIGLILFTFLGPMLWSADPALQDVDQISKPPGSDRSVTLVAPYQRWHGDPSAPGTGLRFAEPPTTQAVRLQWDEMPGAASYRVYRNLFPIGPERALGLPLLDLVGSQTHFEDRLDLQPETYYYTVVGLDSTRQEQPGYTTVQATILRVITRDKAIETGRIDAHADVALGDKFKLTLHPLGTDYLGRDMLARLMHGARVSLFIGLFAPLLYVLFGVIYGSTAGFFGGAVDQFLMRFADFVVALPFLLFMILFKVVFGIGPGESGIFPMLVAMIILSWPSTARLVRGQILQIREEGYIGASRLLGAGNNYLVLRHMIPNTMGVILVTITFAVPSAIFTEAFLSFIGMGVAPPTPSWGSMCNEGIKTMLTTPHELIFPALLISMTVLAFNLLGDGLRDALDARMRNRG